MTVRIATVTIECSDVRRLADFWSAALGYVPRGEISEAGGLEGVIEDPNDRDVELMFIQVPEEKAVTNSIRLIVGADDKEAEMRRLIGLGAAEVGRSILSPLGTVMRDPEGNEFCVFQTAEDNAVKSWRT
ncbi:MAG: VOC family protein [Chloroflexota bacterium]|nr:VOC family protein [Chloroflexota bacterium]